MVRSFRGARGRGVPRPPMMPRHMRNHDYEPHFLTPYDMPSGRMLRGHPGRLGPPIPPLPPLPRPPRGMVPPPLPPLPIPPPHLHPRDLPLPLFRRLRDMPIPIGLPHPRDMPIPFRDMPIPVPRELLPFHLRGRPPGMPPPMHPGPPIMPDLRVKKKKKRASVNGLQKYVQKLRRRKEKDEDDYFCETCDRSWKTQEKLDEHVAEHQVCGRDGCTFTAHPKVILKHVQLQHDSGLYHRIVFTENPADLAKWIAERKSRFPTKENIEKKEAQTSEMIERGERIPSQGKRFQSRGRFGNRGDRRRKGDENHIKPEAGPKQRKPNVKISKALDIEVKWKDPDSWRGELPQFPGTAAFPHSEDSTDKLSTEERHFSDDDEWVENKREINIEKPTVSNVLSSLMLSYGSDMSDNDECVDTNPQCSESPVVSTEKTIEIVPIEKMEESCPGPKHNNHSVDEFITATNKEDSDSGPEESAFEREDKLNIPIPSLKKECETKLTSEPSNKLKSGPKTPVVKPYLKRHQLSLLEKLLRNETRHERNVILQCVRYVVQNNFFSCESTEN